MKLVYNGTFSDGGGTSNTVIFTADKDYSNLLVIATCYNADPTILLNGNKLNGYFVENNWVSFEGRKYMESIAHIKNVKKGDIIKPSRYAQASITVLEF